MLSLDSIEILLIIIVLIKVLERIARLFYVGRYSEKYILVTGCDRGFGNLLAKRLDRLGCYVFASCLTEAGENDILNSCSERVTTLSLDVSNRQSVCAAYKFIREALPVDKGLWAIVNNAGTGSTFGPPEWNSVKDFKKVNKVNLYGLIDVTLTFLPLVKMERGRIINMSSSAGRITVPFVIPYSVSKYGVEAFSDGLRRGLYPFGVKVLLMEPGWHATRLTERKTIVSSIVSTWNNASQEAREEYGETYLNYCKTEMLDNYEKIGSKRPENVVDAYVHALFGRFPRTRYTVGNDMNYIYLPLILLPEWLSDFILCNLDYKLPKPAATINKTF